MKAQIYPFFLTSVLLPSFLVANAHTPVCPPIHFIVNNSSQSNAHSFAHSLSYTDTALKTYLQECKTTCFTLWELIKKHLLTYKGTYGLCATAGMYGFLNAYMYKIDTFLKDKNLWHTWTDRNSLDELYGSDQTLVTHHLLDAIYAAYFDTEHPTDTATPIVHFFKAIEWEKRCLERYIKIIFYIKKLKLSKIVFIKSPSLEKLKMAKRHLLFLEELCKRWVIDCNKIQHAS